MPLMLCTIPASHRLPGALLWYSSKNRGEHMSTLDQLKSQLHGDLITPKSAEYNSVRQIWNGMIDKRPAAIARCNGVADVVATVRFAAESNMLLAIRGGGHNVAGLATCDGGIVIDMSRMKGAHVDPVRRTVRAQAGMSWGDFDR